jgi:Domain of unknown function (DUF397)
VTGPDGHAEEAVVVEVGRHGAFSVNGIGLGGAPFPLSFSVRQVGGSWMVYATAAQTAELADVLMRAAGDTIVVLDLGTNSFMDEDYVQWQPSRIAAEQGVSCQVHPLGALASGVIGLSEEALVMHRDDLPRFLAGWSPYELTLVDLPGQADPGQLDELALAIGTATLSEPILPGLVGSRLRYSGHDDCYFAVESADQAVPLALLGRLLALLAGSELVTLADASAVEVPDPASTTAASLIEDSAHWIGVLDAVSENAVTINLSATTVPWRLDQRLPERVDRIARYDVRQRLWQVTRSVPGGRRQGRVLRVVVGGPGHAVRRMPEGWATGATWRKSSYSGSNGGDCVEVGTAGFAVAIRDSQDPEGPRLAFTAATWAAFAEQVKTHA